MKVCYIGKFRLPNGDAAAARVINIAKALRVAGHDVNFISWGGVQRESDKCDDGKWRIDGFSYTVTDELPKPGASRVERILNKIQRGKKTKRLLCERAESIDAIIAYNNCLCSWLLKFCKKRGIKLISDITEWYAYKELKPLDWLRYTYDMHCNQQRVRNKIVISSYLDVFYNKTHNVVVPATCDATESKWKSGKEKALKIAGTFEGVTLIYAGNPARKDAVHYSIRAVQRLVDEGENIRFLLLGTTQKAYFSRYSPLLPKGGLSESIQFLGKVSQDEVPSFYALSDFMVLIREQTRKSDAGFPTKFAESFTSGTPVVANLTSDLGRYLFDGKTGFLVAEPTEETIYETLKQKVVGISEKKIGEMKRNVKEEAKRLDYHYYVEPLRKFMDDLK